MLNEIPATKTAGDMNVILQGNCRKQIRLASIKEHGRTRRGMTKFGTFVNTIECNIYRME